MIGPDDQALSAAAERLGTVLAERNLVIATAESCTGGWIAKALTDIAGSSAWFGWGIVAYADDAKVQALGVPAALLAAYGAVSDQVVRAMAEGALRLSGADLAVAVSGIAGPGGGSVDKPVGTVYFAWSGPFGTRSERRHFPGSREAVRRATVQHALATPLGFLGSEAKS